MYNFLKPTYNKNKLRQNGLTLKRKEVYLVREEQS